MSLKFTESVTSEADNLSLRFRTVEQAGILVVTRHDRSQDKLEIVLEGGRVKVSIDIGLAEKSFYVGQSLNDDMYHTLIYQRRGMKVNAVVDDDAPVLGTFSLLLILKLIGYYVILLYYHSGDNGNWKQDGLLGNACRRDRRGFYGHLVHSRL